MKKSFSKLAAFTTSVLLLFSFLPILNTSSVALAVDTGWKSPSANDSGNFSNPNNAYASDDSYAYANANGKWEVYKNLNFPTIPVDVTVTGIEVSVEGNREGTGGAKSFDVSLSWDHSQYTIIKNTGDMEEKTCTFWFLWCWSYKDNVKTVGSSSDVWGRTWSSNDFTNPNFRIKLISNYSTPSATTKLNLDQIQVKIYYTSDTTPPTITINNPDTLPAQSKTITASASDGTFTMSNTMGLICDGTLTFVAYSDQTFTSESDNGKKVCYKAVDIASNTAYLMSNAITGIDKTAPTVVLSDDHVDSIVRDADTVIITATFTENDQIDETSPPTISIFTPPIVNNASMIMVSNEVWTYSWNVPSGFDGNHTVTIFAHDRAGNENTAATGKTSYTIDNIAPIATSVDSDSKTFNIADMPTETIKVTFDEDISTAPAIDVLSAVGTLQTVNDCGDLNAKTFCFDYSIPGANEETHIIHIQGAKDIAGNTMAFDGTHTFKVDTIAPTVSITSPSADSHIKGIVEIIADAIDSGSGIAKVEFWHAKEIIKIGEIISFPYSISWNTIDVSDGGHSLWAVAYDNAGNHNQSTSVNVVVENAPRLTVIKHVINDNNGAAMAGDWTMDITATNPSSNHFAGQESLGVTITLDPGSYSVDESNGPSGYSKSLSVDCSGSIALGETKTCAITNDDIVPTLTLIKTVINDNGGTKTVADFPLNINLESVNSGEANTVMANTLYTAAETNQPAGYAASAWGGDCNADGTITLLPGENKTCTITNDDISPKITVTKIVINDNGGTKQVGDFPLFVDNAPVTSDLQINFDAGRHIIRETQQGGYTASSWGGDCDATGNITLVPGDIKACTITNNDNPVPENILARCSDGIDNNGDTKIDLADPDCASFIPKLTVIKIMNNDNGGIKQRGDFSLFVGQTSVASGVKNTFNPGTYTVSETPDSEYAATFSGACDDNGSITLAIGDDKICNITNNDNPILENTQEFCSDDIDNDADGFTDLDDSGCAQFAPVDGGWSEWSVCPVQCGGGVQTRTCTNHTPAYGGADCSNLDGGNASQSCNTQSCVVCGDGVVSGDEVCDDGNIDDGDGCSSICTVEQDYSCNGQPSVCALNPINGGWSEWGTCSLQCGGGTQTRTCDNPTPAYGGNDCEGSDTQSCNEQTCGEPQLNCGDGIITSPETCDDGNAQSGDGCSDACVIEQESTPNATGGGGTCSYWQPGCYLAPTPTPTPEVLGASATPTPTPTPTPEVLGASITCGPYLDSYLWYGRKNPADQVKKLQQFLNDELGAKLPTTGFYGILTRASVSVFQLKYASDIIQPWIDAGLMTEKKGTGNVYKTTLWKINMIMCSDLNLPPPEIP